MISSILRKAGPYAGSGAIVPLAFAYKVFQASDVLVVRTSVLGVDSTLILTTDYTVSLNADQENNPGGIVTPVVAPAIGEKTTLGSVVPDLQTYDVTNAGGFLPSSMEDALDRGIIITQQLAETSSRSITIPFSSQGVSTTLPAPIAGNFLGWNGLGTAIINLAGVASAAVSAAMAPVVAAGTIALALAALGFSPFVITLIGAANAAAFIAAAGIGTYIQNQTSQAFTTGGTSTAFTLTPSPAISAYVATQGFFITLNQAPGANPTIAWSGLAAKNWKYYDRNGVKQFITATVAPSGWSSFCYYDGTDVVMVNVLPPKSYVRLNTANGYGSTNTRIRRFTNVVSNVGSDITYADSATLGGSFTINADGIYAVSYTDLFTTPESAVITLNDSNPTGLSPLADQLANNVMDAANDSVNCSATVFLPSGSVVRARSGSATATGSTNNGIFSITRVS